jgi:hypothetical protein
MPISKQKYKRLTTANVEKAPQKSGVYALYAGSALIYLGGTDEKSATIRSRLKGHVGAAPKEATRYKRETAVKPAIRLQALLREYTKANGRLPKYNNGHSV